MRNKEIFALFIIGLSFIFILFLNGYDTINKWYQQYTSLEVGFAGNEEYYIHSKNSYMLQNEETIKENGGFLEIDIEKKNNCHKACVFDVMEIFNILSKNDISVYINEVYLSIGENNLEIPTDVVIGYEGSWYKNLIYGEYPSVADFNHGKTGVFIGTSLESYIHIVDGKGNIWIEDRYFPVLGEFENCSATGIDNSLVILYPKKAVDKNSKIIKRIADLLNNDDFSIAVGSESSDFMSICNSMIDEFYNSDVLYVGEPGILTSISNEKKKNTKSLSDFLYNIKTFILFIMILLGIVNCILITKMWVVKNMQSLAIMRTYGMSNVQIILRILPDYAKMVCVSLVISVFISIIIKLFTGNINALLNISPFSIVMLSSLVLFVIILSLISVLAFLRRISLESQLKKR